MKREFQIAFTILTTSLLLFSASCSKKTEKAPEPQPTAEAPQGNEAEANASAPAKDPQKIEPESEVDAPNTNAQAMPSALPISSPEANPLKPVPPEAQAAFDNLFYVMDAIGNAGSKDSCTEILSELKKLNDDPLIKEKLISAKTIKDYPRDIQDSIYQANRLRLLSLPGKIVSFNKCHDTPENKEIEIILASILEPLDDRFKFNEENTQKDNDYDSNDEDESENDEDESENDEEDCEKAPDEWLDYRLDDLVKFSHRHEIQGDLSNAKWADLEPTLPVSVLKVSPDDDVIEKLESRFNYYCSDDNKTVTA
ncbi:MAG: hypothetical protein J6A01_00920, partial [Proteobacteria bacterium]|nr:hypothetical protein [Pseudomonadota bacterium]